MEKNILNIRGIRLFFQFLDDQVACQDLDSIYLTLLIFLLRLLISYQLSLLQHKVSCPVQCRSIDAEYIFHNVASLDKRILWLENSAHAATLDFEKHTVFRETTAFFLDPT